MTQLPPVDSVYFDAEYETMPRDRLRELQLELLVAQHPYACEHSALVRSTWDDAGITPRDVRTRDDCYEKVPFVSKDAIRHFRDERGDPYGGQLCVPESE